MLELRNVTTYYASSQVLFGLSMKIEQGQLATLIGRNGMGKTTTVNSIMGTVPIRDGEIYYGDTLISELASFKIARVGVGLVPEGRQIFPNLNVAENLLATAANHKKLETPWTLDRVLELFPGLKPRLSNMGSQLSGGEQQMLAIGRALMLNPSLLILDEATEGLAPLVREEIWSRLAELKMAGLTILLIDKNIDALMALSDQHYIIEKGQIVWRGSSAELEANPELKSRYLGV